MIVAHHGFGEEVILASLAAGGATVATGLVAYSRARLDSVVRWLLPPVARSDVEEAFLDAAERLLVEVGYAGITTRRLAQEAGANHGLVHYYFGSMENLLVRVLERFTERLIARQRAMYAAESPFIDKWRQAMRYLDEDRERYQKVWYELQALAWNRPELRERVAHVTIEWREVLAEAFEQARASLRHRDAARRARRAGGRRSTRGSSSSGSPGSSPVTASCSTGSTTGWRRAR